MFYLPITKSWMISPAARRIYLLCAFLDFALIATFLGAILAMSVARVFILPPVSAWLVRLLLLPEIVGISILMVGMSYFWLGFDTSSDGKRFLWFALVYFGGFFTLPFYCLLVYRRLTSADASQLVKSDQTNGARTLRQHSS